jgi:uncharacterized protein
MEPIGSSTSIDRATGRWLHRTPGNPFTKLHTALYLMAWVLVMAQGWGAYIGSNPTAQLHDPAATSARIANRELWLAASAERAGQFDGFTSLIHDSPEDVLETSIWNHYDVLSVVAERDDNAEEAVHPSDSTNIRLAILLAQAGRIDEARGRIPKIRDPSLRAAVTTLYGEASSLSDQQKLGAMVELTTAGIEEWMLERVVARTVTKPSEGSREKSMDIVLAAPNATRLIGHDALAAVNLLLVALGVFLLLPPIFRIFAGDSHASFGSPWSESLGWAVIIRADFWNRLYFFSLHEFGIAFENPSWLSPFYTWGTVIASLPMLWLIYRHLGSGSRAGVAKIFGIDLASVRSAGIARLATAAVAIDFMGITAIGWGLYWLGVSGVWSEGLDETLLFGTAIEATMSSLDYVVWTPLFEETLFRGLVFFTLRRRMGSVQAAASSSLLFGIVHFYSLPGFLMTCWSGLVWAMVFERGRSLMPAIVAHSIYNVMFVLGTLLVYR